MDRSTPRELLFIHNGLKSAALLVVLMGVSCIMGVMLGEVSKNNGTVTVIVCGMIGLFLLYLSVQLVQYKRWAYNTAIFTSVIVSAWLIFGIVLQMMQGFNADLIFVFCVSIIPISFFCYVAHYLLFSDFKTRLK